MAVWHKYGAKRTAYGGEVYDSKAEAEYARGLDVMNAVGEIVTWRRAESLVLIPGKRGQRIEYRPDFWVLSAGAEGFGYYVDVKGVETPVFKLKVRLLRYVMPDVRLLIVGPRSERWLT